jgi:hypothetical protein
LSRTSTLALADSPQLHLSAASGQTSNLTDMHQDRQQPPSRGGGQPFSDGPAVEDHGRVVTATKRAAAFYRQAQQAVDSAHTVTALRRAVTADPAFGLAVADLDAITQTPPSPISAHQMNWERHHIEVVRTAAAGNVRRAADLLREHLASVGCDPLARRIVTDLRQRIGHPTGPEDLGGPVPDCHPTR